MALLYNDLFWQTAESYYQKLKDRKDSFWASDRYDPTVFPLLYSQGSPSESNSGYAKQGDQNAKSFNAPWLLWAAALVKVACNVFYSRLNILSPEPIQVCPLSPILILLRKQNWELHIFLFFLKKKFFSEKYTNCMERWAECSPLQGKMDYLCNLHFISRVAFKAKMGFDGGDRCDIAEIFCKEECNAGIANGEQTNKRSSAGNVYS